MNKITLTIFGIFAWIFMIHLLAHLFASHLK
jgi:hypothetical protein